MVSIPGISGNKFGWVRDDDACDDYASQSGIGHDFGTVRHLFNDDRQIDTYLWNALLAAKPSWTRGAQGIGDCTSWAGELCGTMVTAVKQSVGESQFIEEFATESIYGGARVEANGGRLGGYSDGSYGAAIVKFLLGWGGLLRLDYSANTGNHSHDLRKYDSEKAKDWGNFGCGGRSDDPKGGGKLDLIAKEKPLVTATRATDVMMVAKAIQNGNVVLTCSSKGFGDMRRNSEGICRIKGTWWHAMMWGGLRWRNGEPDFRNFQSWGSKSCSGPDPEIEHKIISGCSWWIVPEDSERMIRMNDTWIISGFKGMPILKLNALQMAGSWKERKKRRA